MKIIITTVDQLNDVLINPSIIDGDYEAMNIFAKGVDSVPVGVCQALINTGRKMNICFYPYTAKEDLIFRLGCILDKQNEYLFAVSDNFIALPEYAKSEYHISEIKCKPKKVAKSRSRAKSKVAMNVSDAKHTVKAESEVSEADRQSDIKDLAVTKIEVATESVEIKEDVKPEINVDIKPKKTVKKSESIKDKSVKIGPEKYEQSTESELVNQEPIVSESEVEDKNGYTKSFCLLFAKRSGIRANEMSRNWEGEDEELASLVMSLMTTIGDDKPSLKETLQANFVKQDADYLFKWLSPNIKNLRSMAVDKKDYIKK